MVSITLSVPEDVREKMKEFDEMNWSGFIRKCIVQKTEELSLKDTLLQKVSEERGMHKWSLELQKKSREGRLSTLKKRGLLS